MCIAKQAAINKSSPNKSHSCALVITWWYIICPGYAFLEVGGWVEHEIFPNFQFQDCSTLASNKEKVVQCIPMMLEDVFLVTKSTLLNRAWERVPLFLHPIIKNETYDYSMVVAMSVEEAPTYFFIEFRCNSGWKTTDFKVPDSIPCSQ